MEVINQKTTKRFHVSRFDQLVDIDLPALRPLPSHPYEPCQWKYDLRVSEFYLVEWQTNFYSVPYQYINLKVDLRVTQNTIEIFYQRERIASHVLCPQQYQTFILSEHKHPNHLLQSTLTPDELLNWASTFGTASSLFFEKIFSMNRGLAVNLKATRGLKRWIVESDLLDRLELACDYAVRLNIYSVERLKSIIKHQSYLRLNSASATGSMHNPHQNIRGADYYTLGVA